MKIKLTSGDGAELILCATNKIEFALDLARQVGNIEDLMDLHEEFNKGFEFMEAGDWEFVYSHNCPMNPDENFTLELV